MNTYKFLSYIYTQDECHRQHQTKGLFEVSHISRNVFIHCRTCVCHFFKNDIAVFVIRFFCLFGFNHHLHHRTIRNPPKWDDP